jgi:hypothetical protein
MRFTLAELYARADLPAPALAQFDLWISNHPDDSKRANALNGRCRVRALQGQELPKALSDCTAALRLSPIPVPPPHPSSPAVPSSGCGWATTTNPSLTMTSR